MVQAPGQTAASRITGQAPAAHVALCTNLIKPSKALDRIIDQIDDVLVTNVGSVGTAIPIDTKGTGAVLNELMVLPSKTDSPGTAACFS